MIAGLFSKIWAYLAAAGVLIAGVLLLRRDAAQDARRKLREKQAEKQKEARDAALTVEDRVRRTDGGERERVRDKWTR